MSNTPILAAALAAILACSTLGAPAQAQAQPSNAAATTAKKASKPASTDWVARSNEFSNVLLQAQAPFQPEMLSQLGIPGYDDQVFDFGPDNEKRFREATAAARDTLQTSLASERDPNVRQDLQILIKAADEAIASSEVNERLTRPFADVGKTVFQGMNALLSEQVAPERRAKALDRLRRYAGQIDGTTPLATLARERYQERAESGLLQPTRVEVEQSLENLPTYLKGIGELFKTYGIAGSEPVLASLTSQLEEYAKWTRKQVLPTSRTDYALPAELYALRLKEVGIDVEPMALVQRAQLEFMETRGMMQQIAPLIAKAQGLPSDDYRDVIRALKREQFTREEIEPYYRDVVMPELDLLIAKHKVVALPKRPMQMRLASEAESASQPAPHFLPAPLVGNTGQQGTFVLPLGNPAAGADAAYDDFNFPAVAWTLTAHEGRPGHELQFTAMVERGISLARTVFAFNSVNVEGWALYAEAEMVPYEPIEGQMFALQFRLLRAARAMLDPMLNLGQIQRDAAMKVLTDDVVLSKAMARQEIDRYTVNAPGQAGSYFHGYSAIMQLRAETELALGDLFNREAFNDFLLDQGLLPPDLLAKAVREEFVPAQRKR